MCVKEDDAAHRMPRGDWLGYRMVHAKQHIHMNVRRAGVGLDTETVLTIMIRFMRRRSNCCNKPFGPCFRMLERES